MNVAKSSKNSRNICNALVLSFIKPKRGIVAETGLISQSIQISRFIREGGNPEENTVFGETIFKISQLSTLYYLIMYV